MSDATARPANGAPRIELLLIAAAVVILVGIFWYVSSERQTQLRRSASGLDGLHAWFVARDIDSRTFTGKLRDAPGHARKVEDRGTGAQPRLHVDNQKRTAGTEHPAEAALLIDFMLSPTYQEDVPLNMFVYPANGDAALPPEFVEHGPLVDDPLALDPAVIEANRDDWTARWNEIVLG